MRRPCGGGRRFAVRWAGRRNSAIEANHTHSKSIASARAQYRVQMNGSRIDAQIDRLGQFEYWLTAFGRRFHVVSVVSRIELPDRSGWSLAPD